MSTKIEYSGETIECPYCGKEISIEEHDVNWGMCRECLAKDYENYLRENGELDDEAEA